MCMVGVRGSKGECVWLTGQRRRDGLRAGAGSRKISYFTFAAPRPRPRPATKAPKSWGGAGGSAEKHVFRGPAAVAHSNPLAAKQGREKGRFGSESLPKLRATCPSLMQWSPFRGPIRFMRTRIDPLQPPRKGAPHQESASDSQSVRKLQEGLGGAWGSEMVYFCMGPYPSLVL